MGHYQAVAHNQQLLTVTNDGVSADAIIIAGISGKHIEIHQISINSSENSGVVEFNEETSDTLLYKGYLTAQNKVSSAELGIDVASEKGLKLTCPANTFVTVSYHLH